MEVTTIQKFIHTSPRKLRLVADMVRKMEPLRALDILSVTPKAAAQDFEKALKTVLANAKSQGFEIPKLAFKKIEINESMKMRRFRAGTRGRVKPYKKRMSHIKIILTDQSSVLSGQLSEKSQPVISSSVEESKTDKQKTGKPRSENRKPKTDNSKKGRVE